MQITVREGYTDEGIVARFCSPIGQYPRGVVGTSRAGYRFDPEAVITVVKVSHFSVPDDYYSEMEWAHPEEIRFFSSISLARENGKGAIIVYPLSLRYLVELSPFASLKDE